MNELLLLLLFLDVLSEQCSTNVLSPLFIVIIIIIIIILTIY